MLAALTKNLFLFASNTLYSFPLFETMTPNVSVAIIISGEQAMNSRTRITATDSTIMPYPASVIWPALTDYSNYRKWWPRFILYALENTENDLVGSKYALRPYGWRTFYNTVTSYEACSRISLSYTGSYMQGEAEWRLCEKNQGTEVSYAMDAVINDWIVTFLGRLIDLKSIHSFSMKQIFIHLERYILSNTSAKSPHTSSKP